MYSYRPDLLNVLQIEGNYSKWKSKHWSKKLRTDLETSQTLDGLDEIHISLPLITSHQNHLTGEVMIN